MGFLAALGLAKDVGATIAHPIDAVGNVLDKLFTSDQERAAADAVMAKLRQQPMELQVEINKLEAQSKNWFNSGWRPFIGWVCGASLACFYIPQFALASVLWVRMCWGADTLMDYPITQINGLMELVLAMLGMAAVRTFEKVQKVAK